MAGAWPGGTPPPVIPLSLKLEGSHFLQIYIGNRSIFCNKRN